MNKALLTLVFDSSLATFTGCSSPSVYGGMIDRVADD